MIVARHQRPSFGVGDDVLHRRDRQPLADAGPLVDAAILSRLKRDLLDDFGDERRESRCGAPSPRVEPGFLRGDRHGVGPGNRIVRPDLGADAILERRDDLAAGGVVLRVRGERHQHVERKAHGVALYLDVAFLQDVEQADLDLAGEVRQLVDGEDAAVGPRQQPVVHRQLAGELQARLRRLDRIDVADHVGDRDVWRRQLFHVPRVARQPGDRRVRRLP